MAQQGATLQNYNNELVKCIEDLREKREEINKQILKEEEEKGRIQKDLSVLTDRCVPARHGLSCTRRTKMLGLWVVRVRGCLTCSLSLRVYMHACSDHQTFQDQRKSCPESAGAQRVRQDDPGDGGGVHEDPGELADAAARAQEGDRQPHQEEANVSDRP